MMKQVETARLTLRPFCKSDLDDVHAYRSDPNVMRFIGSGVATSPAETAEWLQRFITMEEKHGMSLWAIREKNSDHVIGDCGLFPLEHTGPEVEIAYRLRKDHWGWGYATEAARAMIHYGFATLDLPRIVAVAFPDNTPSLNVLEKIGLQLVRKGRYYGVDGLVFYALERDRWEKSYKVGID